MLEEPTPVGKHTEHSDAIERALRHATLTCLGRARVVRAPGFCQGADPRRRGGGTRIPSLLQSRFGANLGPQCLQIRYATH